MQTSFHVNRNGGGLRWLSGQDYTVLLASRQCVCVLSLRTVHILTTMGQTHSVNLHTQSLR